MLTILKIQNMEKDKVFEQHPTLEVYYKTSDDVPFFQECDAKNHAKGLEDKEVTPVFKDALSLVKVASKNNKQEQLQKAVSSDLMDTLKTKEEKEAEEKAQKEAEEKAQKEAEEKAQKEAEEKDQKEAEEKAQKEAEEKAQKEAEVKKVTSPKTESKKSKTE